MNRISIKDIISHEIRSRSSADLIRPRLTAGEDNVIDMGGVVFISRSFADELYNLQLDYVSVRFENASGDVEKMMQVVRKGRQQKRVRPTKSAPVLNLTSIEDFSDFLLNHV
jgi:hypothetical protein